MECKNQGTPALLVEDLRNLRHALGADSRYKHSQWGFRQHFCPADCDVPSMERLAACGLMRRVDRSDLVMFVATAFGAELIGCSKKRIKEIKDMEREQV